MIKLATSVCAILSATIDLSNSNKKMENLNYALIAVGIYVTDAKYADCKDSVEI